MYDPSNYEQPRKFRPEFSGLSRYYYSSTHNCDGPTRKIHFNLQFKFMNFMNSHRIHRFAEKQAT